MATGEIDRVVVLGVHLTGFLGVHQQVHELVIAVPLVRAQLAEDVVGQALGVDRHVPAGRAGDVEVEAVFLGMVVEVGQLAQPQPGSHPGLLVLPGVRDDDQNPLGGHA